MSISGSALTPDSWPPAATIAGHRDSIYDSNVRVMNRTGANARMRVSKLYSGFPESSDSFVVARGYIAENAGIQHPRAGKSMHGVVMVGEAMSTENWRRRLVGMNRRTDLKTVTALVSHDDSALFSFQHSAKSGLALDDRNHYEDRIKYLRNEAEHDGICLNPTSERFFWHFVNSVSRARRAYLFLLDNGNLRAVWKGESNTQVGLQFRGDGKVQYVIFARRAPEEDLTTEYGHECIDVAINGQIKDFDLRQLVGA